MIKQISIILCFFLWAVPVQAATYYMSPNGSDSDNGTTETLEWKTFSHAFAAMSAGDTLILLDGTYSIAAGTGCINFQGTGSAQPPSGLSISAMTTVKSKNLGSVTVNGSGDYNGWGLMLGRSTTKNSYIKIEGITFEGGGNLYNTSYCTIKNCGFHSTAKDGGDVFGIGTNDHENGNTYNLIEDCWIWGQNRAIGSNYRADYNVWRRVVVRGDGCNSAACTGSGNPNVGITIYDSTGVSFQNVMVIDRILGGGYEYADFATAQHTDGAHYLGPLEWLGCISLKAPDQGTNFEADNANSNSATVRNMVILESTGDGFDIGTTHNGILLENITVLNSGGSGLRVAPGVTGTVRNIISYNAGYWGINSAIQTTYCDVYGSTEDAYNQQGEGTGSVTTNPLADGTPPSVIYPTRIEFGSALKGAGSSGADIGANIIYKYGTDGTRYGDSGYNTLTGNLLWPYPNEELIRTQMATASTRGFCDDGETLTHYIMNYLGNGDPYSNATLTVSTISLPNGTVNSAYSQSLSAYGGTSPYTWNITSGSLPTGLSMASNGAITGTPTVANTYNFNATVYDSNSTNATQPLSITINAQGAPSGDARQILTGRFSLSGRYNLQ